MLKSRDWREVFRCVLTREDWEDEDEHVKNVAYIYAYENGENEGKNWTILGKWDNSYRGGKFFFVTAGCDYTGWDCHAGGWIEENETIEGLLSKKSLTPAAQQWCIVNANVGMMDVDWHKGVYIGDRLRWKK